MTISFVKKVNSFIRNTRPFLNESESCAIFQSGDLLEIGFLSKQCKNDLSGSCLMCDYGRAKCSARPQIYLDEMSKILEKYNSGLKYLLICSNGSILDEYQISTELLIGILKLSQACDIPEIIIETHYTDVTEERLKLIKKFIHKPVIIEMGLETINSKYQNTLFMKNIELSKYEETICRIHSYGYEVEINLMLGLPFLSSAEQLEDIKQSIDWVIDKNCTPIIFPVNIKPHTMLRYIYDKGLYKPISLWLLIILLDDLDEKTLSRIVIAWYGNRDEPYADDVPTIFPQSCDACKDNLLLFGRAFLDAHDYTSRKRLISDLKKTTSCNCYSKIKKKIFSTDKHFDENYNKFYQMLEVDFKDIIGEVKTNDN